MRRRTLHLIFGATAVALAAFVATQAWRLAQADALARAVLAASHGDGTAPAQADEDPRVRLARALRLAERGQFDAAAALFQQLSSASDPALRRTALYDLGNLQLRAALQDDSGDAERSLPMTEVAKQNYRAVLLEAPGDWDARYNLERALWLAPEFEDVETGAERPTGPRERAATTMQANKGDLP